MSYKIMNKLQNYELVTKLWISYKIMNKLQNYEW